ncbi:TetR/AcrR family transcriptional regulator [Rhodophyticola sp. CCM32]|uniref:TetR/AcrR family transcriptional regulator n=1 Tax=Rhodophyticola sp. CCM32 TaxID=2916397 RepID=UPI00107FB661|nr:TetR/AcrR family transcriptional regulator [Rhodophyticola sp. CCM32]QBX99347.1 TetR/AcrR family transcriptional regulator [Rhodophyticola sp. CCM32]
MARPRPFHRDDPDREPLIGNVKVTRQDWLNVALDALVSDGVDQVKVLALGERLGVSRSSFYWYFNSRQDLLDALLDHWEKTNTAALVQLAGAEAATVTGAVCNVFRAVVNPALFDITFDFAVRHWARRSGAVRRVLDRSDALRLEALTAMFARYDYPPVEALTRARVLYYMQIGYNDADLREPIEERLKLVPVYLYIFTGRQPQPDEIVDFTRFARTIETGEAP